jgi:hypothetical protein
MFRRTFWFTTGVAAGVWATTKVNRTIRQLTPENLAVAAAGRAIDAGHRLKDRAIGFALDVRENMAQREEELGDALGLNAPVGPELPAARRFAAIENRNSTEYTKDAEGSAYRKHSYNSYNTYNRNEDH